MGNTTLIGKGLIYNDTGVLAIYNAPFSDPNSQLIATAATGNPLGVVVNEFPDQGEVEVKDAQGQSYYFGSDPTMFKIVDYDPGFVISNDVSGIDGGSKTGIGQYSIDITSIGKQGTTGTTAPVQNGTGTKAVVKGVRKKKFPWLPVAAVALGMFVFAVVISKILKHKRIQQYGY